MPHIKCSKVSQRSIATQCENFSKSKKKKEGKQRAQRALETSPCTSSDSQRPTLCTKINCFRTYCIKCTGRVRKTGASRVCVELPRQSPFTNGRQNRGANPWAQKPTGYHKRTLGALSRRIQDVPTLVIHLKSHEGDGREMRIHLGVTR